MSMEISWKHDCLWYFQWKYQTKNYPNTTSPVNIIRIFAAQLKGRRIKWKRGRTEQRKETKVGKPMDQSVAESSLRIVIYRSRKSSQELKLNFKGWIRLRTTQEMSEKEASIEDWTIRVTAGKWCLPKRKYIAGSGMERTEAVGERLQYIIGFENVTVASKFIQVRGLLKYNLN